MKVLFLFPYPLTTAPSQRFRFEQYLPHLRKAGIEITTQSFWSERAWQILYRQDHYIEKTFYFISGFIRRLAMLFTVSPYRYVFLHREATPAGPPIIEWLLTRVCQKKLLYDFDDAIWIPNTSKENRSVSLLKYPGKVRLICRWSYRISCGNQFLADYARRWNASVTIIPTTIDTENYHNLEKYPGRLPQQEITIGWTGSHSTIGFLDQLVPTLKSLALKFPHVRLVIIADRKPKWTLSSLRFVSWRPEQEISDLISIDIGIMPLPDDQWAQGKCGLKALQFMSLEKPILVSPVGVNKSIVEHGINGFLCDTMDEWRKHLEFLIENPEEGKRLGKNGRKKVIDDYSVRSTLPKYLELFE